MTERQGPVGSDVETRSVARRKRWVEIARDLLLGIVIFGAISWWRGRGVAIGGLPDEELTLLDGSRFRLGGPRAHALLIEVEASWCDVCRMQDGSIAEIAREHDVLVIATQSGDASQVARFAREHGLDGVPIAVDRDGALAARLGVTAFPTMLFVGRDGTVRDVEVGYTTGFGMRARLALASL